MAIDTEERRAPGQTDGSGNDLGGGNNNNNKKILVIVLAVVGGLVILGILGSLLMGMFAKKAVDTIVDTASDGQVKVEGDNTKVKIKGKDGGEATFESTTKMPADFPEAVPLYKDAKLVNVSTVNLGDDGKSFTLRFTSSDDPNDVHTFYKDALSTDGWNTMSSSTSDDLASVMASNDAKHLTAIINIQADDEDGGTSISVTAQVKPNEQ